MRYKFNEYFNSDQPMCPHTAFESGHDAGYIAGARDATCEADDDHPSYFWQGFIMGTFNTAALTAVLFWLI